MPTNATLFYRASAFLLLFYIFPSPAFSQEAPPITFGIVSPKDFDLPVSSLIDSNTNAVIIADLGNTRFIGNKMSDWVSYVYQKTTRIRIINKQAFGLATIRIPLYGSGNSADRLDSLQASTYNLENGKVVETKLNPNDVFKDTLTRGRVETKFTFPSLKEGSIIEYSYKITSLNYWRLPNWAFQYQEYPCLYSKYQVAIPSLLVFLTIPHGQDAFVVNKTEKIKESYFMAHVDVRADVIKHTWVTKDLPSFKTEQLLDHPYNYMDRMEFHLLQTYNGRDTYGNINWGNTTKELLGAEGFGLAVTPENSSALNNIVERISAPDDDNRTAAKKIYSYIRDNFTCEPDDDIYLTDNLYTINKRKKGGVEDLNLLLVALLRQKRINASPVILSTTEYGTNPASYPVLSKMNYVVCMIKTGGDTTFLDASNPLFGFGKLPLDCYNGHARVISDHDSGSVFFNKDAIREQRSTSVFIVNPEKGKGQISGSLETTPGYYESFDIRNKIRRTGADAFLKNTIQSYSPDLTIDNIGIDSVKKLEDPVKIHFDFSFKQEENPDIVYFTPIIQPALTENPYKAATRRYPIEMPYPIDELYVLSMEVPEGFVVDEIPKSAKVAYNGNEGFFEYMIQSNGSNIQLRSHVKLNKATFAAEDYDSLRDFFSYVVKKQSEQIVFKKKK